jgi:NAD(P)H-dependent FMN reductase
MNIAIILASTREARNGAKITEWVKHVADKHDGVHFKLIDLAEVNLPFFDEPNPPMMGKYTHAHTKEWAKVVEGFDGFIFVTPEYNHGYPATLKNALDFLHAEWAGKPVGFIGYGVSGGTRAIEQLIPVTVQLNMIPLGGQVNLHIFSQMDENGNFLPTERDEEAVSNLLSSIKTAAKPVYEARANVA